MPESSKSLPKRKAPAFKPPRPKSATKAASNQGDNRRKAAPVRTQIVTSSSSSEVEEQDVVLTSSPDPEGEISPDASGVSQNPPPLIPPKLLARILHHHFDGDDQKITQRANLLVGKYMDTFVREAIARATYERAEAGGGGVGSDFLEVRM